MPSLTDSIQRFLEQSPSPGAYWVAFSGGLDSTVLLHLLSRLRGQLSAPLMAIHADHGLQSMSAAWAAHCREQCERWGIPLVDISLDIKPVAGESLEAQAREARYAAFADILAPDDMLLTAHHADDQAETLLLQLLRGAGVNGLAGMPAMRAWGERRIGRPLLGHSREMLERYAAEHDLDWIEDLSNRDDHFDRNFLRNQVVPLLKQRWPGLEATMARSARHLGQARAALDELAAMDRQVCAGNTDWQLEIAALSVISRARQENLLRGWIDDLGLPVPDSRRLAQVLDELVPAADDAAPLVAWGEGGNTVELRRFAGRLCLMPGPAVPPEGWRQHWDGKEALALPGDLGELHCRPGTRGIAARWLQAGNTEVGFRRDGLKCRPVGRQGSRSFKRLCQDYAIAPWLRERVPLLFVDGQLAAVGDYCVCDPFAASEGEPALALRWLRPDYLL